MDFFKKIASGIAIGLGFTISAVAVVYLLSGIMMAKLTEEAYSEAEEKMADSDFGYRQFDESSGLRIKSHKERPINNGVEILVEIENAGELAWSSVGLEVELFDENKNFVDECSGYLRGKIKPGETKNSKVKCGGCENNQLPKYSTYEVTISNATSF